MKSLVLLGAALLIVGVESNANNNLIDDIIFRTVQELDTTQVALPDVSGNFTTRVSYFNTSGCFSLEGGSFSVLSTLKRSSDVVETRNKTEGSIELQVDVVIQNVELSADQLRVVDDIVDYNGSLTMSGDYEYPLPGSLTIKFYFDRAGNCSGSQLNMSYDMASFMSKVTIFWGDFPRNSSEDRIMMFLAGRISSAVTSAINSTILPVMSKILKNICPT